MLELTRAAATELAPARQSRPGHIPQVKARQEVGELLGINPSTLRNSIAEIWARGHPVGRRGHADDELAGLRRENARRRRAKEILKAASAFLAAATFTSRRCRRKGQRGQISGTNRERVGLRLPVLVAQRWPGRADRARRGK
jgi:transposase